MLNLPTVNQSSNKISRRFNPLERTLKQELEKFYRKRIKGSNAPIQVIEQKYNHEVEQIIRNHVQSSWIFAHEIIKDRTNVNVNLTTKDIEGIEETTDLMTSQFWETSRKNQEQEQKLVINKSNQLEEVEPYDLAAAMTALSLLMLYLSFNRSMLSKAVELDVSLKLRFTTRDNCIDTIICLPLNGNIYSIGSFMPTPPLHRNCRCRLIPVLS